jgi:Copper type II ascorbate-dependent monooxygenase, C-terminal domain
MKISSYLYISTASVALFLAIQSCTTTENIAKQDTFAVIQNQILTPSCATAGCHATEADGNFKQHGLILTKGLAFKNLVGATVFNITAKEDGLQRVKAFDASKSLLYHKLNYDISHHGGRTYGNVMPLGAELLTVGQIEYVRRWIEAGAPETGNVVDVKLLEDKTPSAQAYTPLEKPADGKGFQMVLDKFDVAPNFERELFVRKSVGNTEPVYVNRVQIKMRPGTHHFILYDFRDKNVLPGMNSVRDIRNPDGTNNIGTLLQMSNHVFAFGGAEAVLDDVFPAGTAVEVPAGATYDMNSHYFNKGTKAIPGEVSINLYTTPKSEVKNVVKILDLGINSTSKLRLPANKSTVITEDYMVGKSLALRADKKKVKIVTLFSHTHKLGQKFEILIKGGSRDGQVVYTSQNWEHPVKIKFDKPLELEVGEGLTSRITYNNFTDKVVTFGLTSEDEMGIIFGYYYEE